MMPEIDHLGEAYLKVPKYEMKNVLEQRELH